MANHCENCGSNFTRSDSLKRHQNVCDIRKNSKMAIQYENCGSNFTRSDSLKRRQNVCDIRKNWRKCDKCGKTLASYKTLWQHKKTCKYNINMTSLNYPADDLPTIPWSELVRSKWYDHGKWSITVRDNPYIYN